MCVTYSCNADFSIAEASQVFDIIWDKKLAINECATWPKCYMLHVTRHAVSDFMPQHFSPRLINTIIFNFLMNTSEQTFQNAGRLCNLPGNIDVCSRITALSRNANATLIAKQIGVTMLWQCTLQLLSIAHLLLSYVVYMHVCMYVCVILKIYHHIILKRNNIFVFCGYNFDAQLGKNWSDYRGLMLVLFWKKIHWPFCRKVQST